MTSEFDPLGTVIRIARLHRTLAKELDRRLGELHGLSSSDLEPLLELHAADGHELLASRLGTALGLPTSELVRRLGPLERIGMLARVSEGASAREMRFVLTEAGASILQDAIVAGNEAATESLESRWSPVQLEQLAELLGP